jgi:hypothetical protein
VATTARRWWSGSTAGSIAGSIASPGLEGLSLMAEMRQSTLRTTPAPAQTLQIAPAVA